MIVIWHRWRVTDAALLGGVGRDARHIVDQIVSTRHRRVRTALR